MNPSVNFVKYVCYPEQRKFQTESARWCVDNEGTGLQTYFDTMNGQHSNFNVKRTGLIVLPNYPLMGASPDPMMYNDCHGTGCVELKCPFKYKNSIVEQALCDPYFCSQRVNGLTPFLHPLDPSTHLCCTGFPLLKEGLFSF